MKTRLIQQSREASKSGDSGGTDLLACPCTFRYTLQQACCTTSSSSTFLDITREVPRHVHTIMMRGLRRAWWWRWGSVATRR
jgi:hypothetical protein